MAKQNNDQGFADETQQNKKTKENLQKETKNQKKQKQRKDQKQKQGGNQKKKINRKVIIWLIPTIGAVINISYALRMFFWAKEIGKSSVYLDFVADIMMDAAMLVVELLLLISTIFFIFKRKNVFACVTTSVIMGVILYGLLAVNLKVVASINADKEMLAAASTEKWSEVLSRMQNQEVYQLRQYILEEDLFMENLEQYCGIPDNNISQEERPGKMAEIILLYLKSNVIGAPEKKTPYNYGTNVLMGDFLYKDFTDYIKKSKNPENGSIKNKIYDYALNILNDATNCRIVADNSLHTAENRRLIGLYYIDAGDCNQLIGEIDSAAESFENAAEWAVKSIYLAAIVNDVEAMKEAWEVLNSAANRLEEVEWSSDGDNVQKVNNIRDAYEIVINQWE